MKTNSNMPYKLAKSRASAQRFHDAVADAKVRSDHGAGLDLYSVDDYEDMHLYINHSNSCGFAITSHKDLVCLFKKPSEYKVKGWELARQAAYEGARSLNCFDGYLTTMYRKAGWVVYDCSLFDDTMAPEGWDYTRDGRPDVIFMTNLFHELDV